MNRYTYLFIISLVLGWLTFFFHAPVFRDYLIHKINQELTIAEKNEFNIIITKLNLKRLEDLALKSIELGFLKRESKKWVPCKVVSNGIYTKCKLRLRGDLPKHWNGLKRSYRLKFNDPSPFWGWKKVDLILPEDKGFESELAGYEIAKKLELIAPGASFSSVSINGIRTGSYFVKQGDSGSLFELNRRTESMMVRENNIWWFAQYNGSLYPQSFLRNAGDKTNLKTHSILYSPTFSGKAAYNQTFSRFASFLKATEEGGDLRSLLDIKSYYRWLAIVMCFGSTHSILGDNLFWYINSSTGLAEPVLYDLITFRLSSDPFRIFKFKNYIIRMIHSSTWNIGGKHEFEQALKIIEKELDPIYLNVIKKRVRYSSMMRREDYFSESDALSRLGDIKSNIALIKKSLP
jgi:hypothetical protein